MDQLFFDLFGQVPGTSTAMIVSLSALSTVLSGLALVLLAVRSDLGWWAKVLSVFAGPLTIALLYTYADLVHALPLMAVAAYGLWRFSKYPTAGRFGRDVRVRGASARAVAWGVALVLAFTALGLGQMLTSGLALSPAAWGLWANAALGAVVTAGFVGIAHGIRAAWLAVAAASAGFIALFFANQPALATLGALVLQLFAALYGWWAWRPAPAEAAPAAADEAYPPSPYTT
ncbi:nicotinamide mononucleotide transporter [Zafaria sp. J156]|uniref:nicotinamide mononucleotide transporter n=1 Tax=Zafaria sp. J156 TaxID=3116490 RepID=UPI002E79F83C|nr:nicotinamide mononucleotide transporter [Zafaria sp. J156]MEE1621286.1 nicotinamide mononucleotide transporter [Zafaria sp. J156]